MAVQVYSRRSKRPWHCRKSPSFFEALSWKIDPGSVAARISDDEGDYDLMPRKKRRVEIDRERGISSGYGRVRSRGSRRPFQGIVCGEKGKVNAVSSGSRPVKRWTE